jgi:hypothetical protein
MPQIRATIGGVTTVAGKWRVANWIFAVFGAGAVSDWTVIFASADGDSLRVLA